MRRILDFRIVRWEFKVLYVAVAWILGFVIVNALASVGTPSPVVSLVNLLTLAVPFALAVRIFRGQGEPVDPPRAWWRMTAWPTLSGRLGVLFAVFAVFGVVAVGLALAGATTPGVGRTPAMSTMVGGAFASAVLAGLYLHSAARMRRLGIAKPEQLPPPVRMR